MQGFKKKNRDRNISEYENEEFQGVCNNPGINSEKPHLEAKLEKLKDEMNKINKKITERPNNPELGIDLSYFHARIEQLKGYTNTMKVEIMELRQHQESIRSYSANMNKRIENNNEHKKEQIRISLEKVFANPIFRNQYTQLMIEKRELASGQITKKRRLEDPRSSNNMVLFDQVENGESRNEDDVITVERKDEKPASHPVEYERDSSKEPKVDEAVEWGNLDLTWREFMFWNTILIDELNYQNEAQAKAELAKFWQEK